VVIIDLGRSRKLCGAGLRTWCSLVHNTSPPPGLDYSLMLEGECALGCYVEQKKGSRANSLAWWMRGIKQNRGAEGGPLKCCS
jgi:hypothetical protein